MDAAEWLEIEHRFFPCELHAEIVQRFHLALPQDWKWLDDPIAKRGKEIRDALAHSPENIAGEVAMVGSLFNDDEIIGPAHQFPHLGELRGQQPSKKRTDADIRKVIATPPDDTTPGTVVANLRVIKRLFHEPLERDGPVAADCVPDEFDQNGIAGVHRYVYR